MKLDLEIHASDLEENFHIKLECEDVTEDYMAFVLASIFNAFEIIERDGLAGAANMAGKAIAIAEVMHEHKDKITEERIEN